MKCKGGQMGLSRSLSQCQSYISIALSKLSVHDDDAAVKDHNDDDKDDDDAELHSLHSTAQLHLPSQLSLALLAEVCSFLT